MPSDPHVGWGRAHRQWRVKIGRKTVFSHDRKASCVEYVRKNGGRLVAPGTDYTVPEPVQALQHVAFKARELLEHGSLSPLDPYVVRLEEAVKAWDGVLLGHRPETPGPLKLVKVREAYSVGPDPDECNTLGCHAVVEGPRRTTKEEAEADAKALCGGGS